MGMSTSKTGSALSEPNIVPLIDILLVLIIIFMVVTPLTPKGLKALVPQPNPDQSAVDPLRTIVVQIACADFPACRTSTVKINDTDSNWEVLQSNLLNIFKTRAEKVGFVKGEDDVTWHHIARAIDMYRSAQVDKVGLMTKGMESE